MEGVAYRGVACVAYRAIGFLGVSLVVFDCVCGWGVVWGVAGVVRSRIWVGVSCVVLGGGLACFWSGVN